VSRRIAVTGASGFIGRHVTAHLAARGDQVVVVRRPFEHAELLRTLHGADAVVHLAGVVAALREQEYFTANVAGTRAIAGAARAAGMPLIHISSLAAAGPASPRAPRSEDDPSSPINAYGLSKLEGERVIAETDGLRWTILRPGVVYGPGDRALLPVFRLARRGILPLVGRTDAAYTFIHIADLVRVIATAVDSPAAEDTMFVGHPEPVTTRDLLEGVRAASGGRGIVVRIPLAVTRLAALAGDAAAALFGRRMVINSRRYAELASEGFVCRVDRLRDRLGVMAEIGLRDGLADAYAWYRREGWL
jgi:nucleoside-diphosphate-sugar epimerase